MSLRGFLLGISAWCAILMVGLFSPLSAQQKVGLPILDVGNHRGGKLRDQISQIDILRRSGQPVHITGDYCYSTCTMYLGLPQTCVLPQTVFGFHAPSQYGRRLDQATFERASQLIVAHYPPILHDWYMAHGRHQHFGMLKVTGAHLIRIGAAQPCVR
ncbi:MAG: hypothetical protein AAFP98_09590 [Pseudomonadota bacterium]